ncbi:hypothetical protein [Streptosporangium sp. NPDC006930]|uniref:hypothetical protein n=1 Tax=Streptosporangium sp. NPDC006930 TaxID=3154783 RepID=UPI0034362BC9
MPLPNKQKGGPGAITPGSRPNTQQGVHDTPKIQPQADMRSNRAVQTSLPVVAAAVYQVGPGLKKAVLVVAECPFCTWAHRHECEWPAPSLMKKRARCGGSYDVLPYKAAKRGARKRAA